LRSSKIVPISSFCNINVTDQDHVANAENEVRNTLDDLQATGVLQSKNKMDIEALLNPHEEPQMMDGTRDEEICQAVLAMRNAQEEGPTNGGDDNVEDDSPLAPCPTRHEVFRAASVINRYVQNISTIPLHASLKQF